MDASLELQQAILPALFANTDIRALVGARLYDRIPAKATGEWNTQFPFIALGPTTVVPDDYDCVNGEEITIQLDVWSSASTGEGYDSIQGRKIANMIKRTLHNADLPLATNALVSFQHVLTRQVGDPNPALHHFAVQFRAEVETP